MTPDTLGNHRVVLSVKKTDVVVKANIPWRINDKEIEQKGIIIINAQTGDIVSNFLRQTINQEHCTILFQALTAGDYYLYYLPYKTSGGPYPRIKYQKESTTPDEKWLSCAKNVNLNTVTTSKVKQYQSLSSFDSFYPMEIIATSKEKAELIAEHSDKPYLLFPEDREHSIKMLDEIPYRWINRGAFGKFYDEVDMNEYFVCQIGLWAYKEDVNKIKVKFSDLKGEGGTIPSSLFTCFNTEGKDWLRRDMSINLDVPKGKVQALWIGMDIPATGIKKGLYRGFVTVEAEGLEPQKIEINISLSDYFLVDRGDSDMHRLSRLRWLNSDYAFDNKIVKPFTPVKKSGDQLEILGRSVTLDKYGLPATILSYFTEEMTTIGSDAKSIINEPFRFVIQQNKKSVELQNTTLKFTEHEEGIARWESANTAGDLDVNIKACIEFDGFMQYEIKVTANKTTSVDDIRLEVPMNSDVAKYWLGTGHEGSFRPKEWQYKWDVKKHREGYWLGDVNAGIQCVFRDINYIRPLNTNFYHQQPLNLPPSWYNNGKGGFEYKDKKGTLLIKTYSGKRTINKGEELNFIFNVSITPFKPIDTDKQWSDRYIHTYVPINESSKSGANVINIHHGQAINPYINYPFFRPDFMKHYVDQAHAKGSKVKIYYTVRELANRAPEVWALRSLNHEVFAKGDKLGYSWLREHLGEDYIAAWFVDDYKDAAIVNTGISRWHNFYVEGLEWLVKNVGIDGIYIDDLAFDRTTMKRVRKVLEAHRPEPRIDLHSANQFNKSDGFINSAFLYMEHMPYLDRLWFGEYFDYNKSPDYWMMEVSGIPFGMMSEMLEDGGNPWRGMLYGMTNRYGWIKGSPDPKLFWDVWDDFGIEDSRMLGYWVSYNPIKTNNKDVLATTFVKDDKVMVALASWADKTVEVKLQINWDELGLDPQKTTVRFPDMPTLQKAKKIKLNDTIKIEPKGGCLIILE